MDDCPVLRKAPRPPPPLPAVPLFPPLPEGFELEIWDDEQARSSHGLRIAVSRAGRSGRMVIL